MARYAAFLRGINLGRRRVTGPELCAAFVELGFSQVDSFIASGNVVFGTDDAAGAAELTAAIEAGLEERLGYPVVTFLRTDSELGAIVARTPFSTAELQRSTGKPQVILLREPPPPDVAAALLDHAGDDDRLALNGAELHWLPLGNMSASELDLTAINRIAGPTTIRTANTLARLHAKYFAG